VARIVSAEPRCSHTLRYRWPGLWRKYCFLVFAGLFVLLAVRPRRYTGVWELAIFHKVATFATAAALAVGGAAGGAPGAVADGILAVTLIVAYLLARGHAVRAKPGADPS
jgi:hypothetical protein